MDETFTQLFQAGLENMLRDNLHYFVIPLLLGFVWFVSYLFWNDKHFKINYNSKSDSIYQGLIFVCYFIFLVYYILSDFYLRLFTFFISGIFVFLYLNNFKILLKIKYWIKNLDDVYIFVYFSGFIITLPAMVLAFSNLFPDSSSKNFFIVLLLIVYFIGLSIIRNNHFVPSDYFSLYDKNLKNILIKKFLIIQKEEKGFLIKIVGDEKEFDFIKFEDMKYVKEFNDKNTNNSNKK